MTIAEQIKYLKLTIEVYDRPHGIEFHAKEIAFHMVFHERDKEDNLQVFVNHLWVHYWPAWRRHETRAFLVGQIHTYGQEKDRVFDLLNAFDKVCRNCGDLINGCL